MSVIAFLSLGSNLGNRTENLRAACGRLKTADIHLLRVSSVYETEPVDVLDQGWFLNCVVEIETGLAANVLLDRCAEIEADLGRGRSRPKGPRIIDIDILLYGDAVIETEPLTVPHPRMKQRRFVLEPLREIAPTLRVPPENRTVEELLQELEDRSQVRRVGTLAETP